MSKTKNEQSRNAYPTMRCPIGLAALCVGALLTASPVSAEMAKPECTNKGLLTSSPEEVTGTSTSGDPRWAVFYAQVVCEGNAHQKALQQLVALWGRAEEICGEGCRRQTIRAESPILVGCDDQHTHLTTKSDAVNHHAVSKGLVGSLFEFRCVAD